MENFFYEDRFCSDLGDLMDELGLYEESDINELDENWSVDVMETKSEKIFVLKKDFVLGAVMNATDKWEERFPEDSGDVFKQIEKAVGDSIDIDKMNELLPSLWYPSDSKVVVTKQDLIDYCK